jgi:hypothetical protein
MKTMDNILVKVQTVGGIMLTIVVFSIFIFYALTFFTIDMISPWRWFISSPALFRGYEPATWFLYAPA